jgi:hypothetical protein
MAWVVMRGSVPCVLRHRGDAANDPRFRRATDPPSRRPRHARRFLAVFLLWAALAAFALARKLRIRSNRTRSGELANRVSDCRVRQCTP